MRIELRRRMEPKKPGAVQLSHVDLLVILESEDESQLVDKLGQPGTTFTGEVRIADGYGEHYLLIQPTKVVYTDGEREIPKK